MTGPLAGVRILDLTHFVAGPWCTMLLADLGAEITKIEPLDGEISRTMGGVYASGESAIFLGFNRGKRSLALDLKRPEGLAIAQQLAREADVVVQNFRPGTAERLEMDAVRLRADHEELIYCAITAFGSGGPYASRPGNDPIIQALSGAMSATGSAGGVPIRMGVSLPDLSAGMLAATAILAALHRRTLSGEGANIELNLLDSQMFSQMNLLTDLVEPGSTIRQADGQAWLHATYLCQDGLALCLDTDDSARFADAVREVTGDSFPASATLDPDDQSNKAMLRSQLAAVFAGQPRESWLSILHRRGIDCAPVLGLDDVLGKPVQTIQLEHPTVGRLRQVRTPVTVDPPWPVVDTPPPRLGEHSRNILQRNGITSTEIDRLAEQGVIADGPAQTFNPEDTRSTQCGDPRGMRLAKPPGKTMPAALVAGPPQTLPPVPTASALLASRIVATRSGRTPKTSPRSNK